METNFLFNSKSEVLNWFQGEFFDSFTSVAVYDVDGGNRQITSECFLEFFDEDNAEYLPSDSWQFLGAYNANEENFDFSEWMSDMPKPCADDLKGLFELGMLFVAKFRNEDGRHMDIVYWPNYTFDVQFDSETSSNSEGFNASFYHCKYWIGINRNDRSTYFGDYIGGTVSIVCNETGETVYSEQISEENF